MSVTPSVFRRAVFCLFLLTSSFVFMLETKAEVNVRFVHPENFRDEAFRGDWYALSPKDIMNELDQEFQQLGRRYLPPGRTLDVEILDIQLAGYVDSWAIPGRGFRVRSQGGPWPRFKLRYTLKANSKRLATSEETISDPTYLMTHPSAHYSADPLVYEKILLENWFKTKFARHDSRS